MVHQHCTSDLKKWPQPQKVQIWIGGSAASMQPAIAGPPPSSMFRESAEILLLWESGYLIILHFNTLFRADKDQLAMKCLDSAHGVDNSADEKGQARQHGL